MPLTLDKETIPLEASMLAEYPRENFQPPANYKSAEAIAGFYEKSERDWRANREKECSLNPRLGRIVCFGYAGPNGDAATLYAMTEADEKALLVDAWTLIAAHEGRVVTWNGSFDLRWLVIRSMANGVAPLVDASTVREWFKRYAIFSHFDVKAVLLNWDHQKMMDAREDLDTWANFFGVGDKSDDLDGSMMGFLFRDGSHELIREHCMSDVRKTKAMHSIVSRYFGGNI